MYLKGQGICLYTRKNIFYGLAAGNSRDAFTGLIQHKLQAAQYFFYSKSEIDF